MRNSHTNSFQPNNRIKLILGAVSFFALTILFASFRHSDFTDKFPLDTDLDESLANDDYQDDSYAAGHSVYNRITAPEVEITNTALRGAAANTGSPTTDPTHQYNILILTSDDLSATAIPPYVAADHPMHPENLNPSYNNFLKTATTFHGIAPVPVCGPSRASFLTGRLPDRTDLYTFERYIPQIAPNISTVFQYFKDKLGYESFVAGKIFHTLQQDINRQVEYYTGQLTQPRVATQTGNSDCVGYMYCRRGAAQLADTNIVAQMDKFFQAMSKKPNKRFIAGAGLHRPHLTNGIPAQYLKGLSADMPDFTVPDIPGANDFYHSLAYKDDLESAHYKILIAPSKWQRMVQSPRTSSRDIFTNQYSYAVKQMIINYYAGIRFTLNNFGSILNSLDKYGFSNNTVVVMMSDHGWQTGERRMLGKNTLYPPATNVLFSWHLPGQTQAYFNPYPVSTRALYPTLIELIAGKNALKNFADGSGMQLDGVSLLPALTNESYQAEEFVISQYPRCQGLGQTQTEDCMTGNNNNSCSRPPILFMGYSAITKDYRYVEWRRFIETRTSCDYPTWQNMPAQLNNLGGKFWQINPKLTGTDWNSAPLQPELYAVVNGQIVSGNLANNPTAANQQIMDQFSSKIKQKLQNVT